MQPTEPHRDPDFDKEVARRRKSRNIALGLLLGFFVVLFYTITIVRIGGQ
ncbi:hypothetical protein ACXYN8_10350 [Altererythrobacter sp. CAU 1778]